MEHPDDRRVRRAYEWLDTKLPWLVDVKDFVVKVVTSVVDRIGVLLFIILAVVLGNWVSLAMSGPYTPPSASDSGSGSGTDIGSVTNNYSNCNVVGIEIRDCIYTYKPDPVNDPAGASSKSSCDVITSSESVVGTIENAKDDNKIKAVLLEIDSSGGMPAAAAEIADAMKALGKPSVAWIRGYGDSAAYWIASSANTIVAGANSDVGSIGVTQSYVDNSKQNQTKGLTYNQITTGIYKDTGNPDKPLTASDRTYLERDLNIVFNNFINAVAINRHLSVATVRSLADGSSMLGVMAKQNGLVDKIGTKQVVWDTLEKAIGEKPNVCW